MPTVNTNRRLSDAEIASAEAVSVGDISSERGLLLKRCGCELVGPCPLCGGRDRFAINVTENIWNCRGCNGRGRGAIAFLQWLDACGFRDAVEMLIGGFFTRRNLAPDDQNKSRFLNAKKPLPADHDRRQHGNAAWLWSQRKPITGTIAETYLRTARGITCPLPPTLGFLAPRKPDQHPAMISAFSLCDEVEPGVIIAPRDVQAVHLTLLMPDGTNKADTKPNKLMIGSPGGLPIVLAPPNDLLGLAITEGIEDALSVHQATGLGAWAAGSAPHMSKLAAAVPDWIDCVTIFADANEAGESNSAKLAAALSARGIFAEVLPSAGARA